MVTGTSASISTTSLIKFWFDQFDHKHYNDAVNVAVQCNIQSSILPLIVRSTYLDDIQYSLVHSTLPVQWNLTNPNSLGPELVQISEIFGLMKQYI